MLEKHTEMNWNFYGKSFRKMQFGGGRIRKNGTVYY